MNIFEKFFSRKPKQEQSGSGKDSGSHPLDAVTFDLSGCEFRGQDDSKRGWRNPEGVVYMLAFSARPSWTFDLTEVDKPSQFYGQQCRENAGVMLEMQIHDVEGIEVLSGLFKYRAGGKGNMALVFVGIIWIPFQECIWQLNIEAQESGMTGLREALVLASSPDEDWPVPSDEPPVQVNSAEEMFELMAAKPLRILPSDDEKHDKEFPAHPLSMVRNHLHRAVKTLKFDPKVRTLKLFRK